MSEKKIAGFDASQIISQASKRNREITPYKPASGQQEPPEEVVETPTIEDVPVEPATASREEARKRKSKGQDYESLFIRDAPTSTRSGRTVYIRREFHERIIKIIRVIGHNDVSLFSYLDNVLDHHFKTFQEDISELYKKRDTEIF